MQFLRVKNDNFEGAFDEGNFFPKMRVRLFIFEGAFSILPMQMVIAHMLFK